MKKARTSFLAVLCVSIWTYIGNAQEVNTITLQGDKAQTVISKDIYGHFAEHLGRCIYEGIWVGENSTIPNTRGIRNDVVAALKDMNIPVLRWPGGCFADTYHWKDGIGNKDQRASIVNVNWGGVTEDNSFGTHEFLDLCEMLGCDAYISGNVGSGTVQEMAEWAEYMTSDAISPMTNLRKQNGREKPWKVKYFGIGNEAWGCGGNMTPEHYSDLCRQYGTYLSYAGRGVQKVASGASDFNLNWTDVVMKNAGWSVQGIGVHYYTLPKDWSQKGSATNFKQDEYTLTTSVEGSGSINRDKSGPANPDSHPPSGGPAPDAPPAGAAPWQPIKHPGETGRCRCSSNIRRFRQSVSPWFRPAFP